MIDAYTWTTPNGFKLLIALEELQLPYKLHWIDIGKGAQSTPEFVKINPNSKIPALVDGAETIFESGACLLYLAEKTGKLMPQDKYAALAWMFFQVGGPGPMLGQYAHFEKMAKEKVPYAIDRYKKESERLMKVLDGRLGEAKYLAGSELSMADIINWTWPNAARSFLGMDLSGYPNLTRWLDELGQRDAFKKAMALKP
jgi:GSH-dependent disulfide-bond oxidoreductase